MEVVYFEVCSLLMCGRLLHFGSIKRMSGGRVQEVHSTYYLFMKWESGRQRGFEMLNRKKIIS